MVWFKISQANSLDIGQMERKLWESAFLISHHHFPNKNYHKPVTLWLLGFIVDLIGIEVYRYPSSVFPWEEKPTYSNGSLPTSISGSTGMLAYQLVS